jgi:RimJ/RimL family protein N-acetyltransferase
MVPTLTTDRLVMRAWRDDDLESYAAMTADPEVMRFMGGPIDAQDAWRQVALFVGHWDLRGYGFWAIEREGELIGRVGLWQPHGWPGLEVGWLLARDAWGRGYATEAARACVRHGFEELGIEKIVADVLPGKVQSMRVLEKCGFERVADLEDGRAFYVLTR